jgi:serine phosphatase RsbU (regulator of sigma subunit)
VFDGDPEELEDEVARSRERAASDRDRIADLEARRSSDAEQIGRLRSELADSARDLERVRREAADDARAAAADSRAQSALIARLREEAKVHDAALVAVRDQLAGAEHELDDLRAVRDALTPPELPERPGLALAAGFLPATQRVSGDFYLAAPGPGESTVVVVGDVVGKGIVAARQAAFVRTAFAATATFSTDPGRLLGWANVALGERVDYAGSFVTAACLSFEPETRTLRIALAGHPPPLCIGSGEDVAVGKVGVPLGVEADVGCDVRALTLEPGDGLLLYTDGLVETRRDGELFGIARARDVIRRNAGRPDAELLGELRDATAEYGGGTLTDDLCLVSVSAT